MHNKAINAFSFQNVIEWHLWPSQKFEVETGVDGMLL